MLVNALTAMTSMERWHCVIHRHFWNRALPQLATLAVQQRDRPIGKIRQMLLERFERDIMTGLDRLNSWVSTAIKTAPQLGLLGTVLGMINAFAKIAGAVKFRC